MTSEDQYDDLTTRRTVLRGVTLAGVAVAAAPLLAACGGNSATPKFGGNSATPKSDGGSSSTPPSETSPGETTSAETTAAPAGLIATSDVPVGGGVILKDQVLVVTQPTAGEFHCFTAICTHQGCTVGTVSDGEIICPCHGSRYSIEDGSVVNGPAPAPLAEEKIVVKGAEISLA